MIGSLFLNKTYSRAETKGLLEAILFVSGKPIAFEDLKKTFEMNDTEMQALIDELNEDYKSRYNGFQVIPVAGGCQIVTSPHYKDELNEIFGRRNENKVPKSALETLAVIAYKQPVSKEDVDKIRGVSSTRSINSLLALKLVNISGSADDIVKSPLYSTTERFLEFFRLKSIEDLPSLSTIDFSKISEADLDIPDDGEGDEGPEIPAETENKDKNIFEQ